MKWLDWIKGKKNYQKIIAKRPWHKDLCEYYKVTPEEALELGTRKEGRRPSLPGSPTTHPVSGKTLDEIWEQADRSTPEGIHSFYKEMGAWAAFRQVVWHKSRNFEYIKDTVKQGDRICEYGGGIGPISFWLLKTLPDYGLGFTVVDVASEHLTFGEWRLKQFAAELGLETEIEKKEVGVGQLPLDSIFNMIIIFEVYEHLHNPLEVTKHLDKHLASGGCLWENYIKHKEADGCDLEIAQTERDAVFDFIRSKYDLVFGPEPESDTGENKNRCWRKR
ncbi:MAG: class I SAM-dependent methyltransferase [Verrucomicrobiota bacterium]